MLHQDLNMISNYATEALEDKLVILEFVHSILLYIGFKYEPLVRRIFRSPTNIIIYRYDLAVTKIMGIYLNYFSFNS
jgi:hypothetical protein